MTMRPNVWTALRISNGSFMGTALECFKLGGVCFLVPFLFVAFPNILDFPNLEIETLAMLPAFALATFMLSAATYGAVPSRSLAVGPTAADVPVFLRATGDEDYEVATVSLSALAGLGVPPDATAQLEPLLDSGNPYVALSAANAILTLDTVGDPSAD